MKVRLFLIAILACVGIATAQNIPAPMSPARLVNDYAGLLNSGQRAALEDSLVSYDRSTSTQIVVVTVNDLDGASAAQYATKLLTEWGVGQKGRDNGVVLLLKPRNNYGGGEVFIATGYGADGALPDILCGQIIDFNMMSALKAGDYATALDRGAAAIRDALRGEYQPLPVQQDLDWPGAIFGTLLVLFFIVLAVIKAYREGPNGDNDSDGAGGGHAGRNFRRGPIMFPPIMGGMGGGSGGFGGGGFGGFGGGMGGGGGGGRSF